MKLMELLEWRYATKKYNGKKIPAEKLDYILEAARLAPSSSGIQPYKIFAVGNQEMKEKMKTFGYDQQQYIDASHILIFASWDHYTPERIGKVFDRTVAERGLQPGAMNDYRDMLMGMYGPLGQDWQANHAAKQAYISFGFAIIAAAEQGIDATPMEGFIPAQMDELLGLEGSGWKSTLVLTLGYRDTDNDWLVNLKKVRTPLEEFVVKIE